MNASSSRISTLFSRLARATLTVAALAATTATSFAGASGAQVFYNPTLQAVDGILPYSRPATIAITAPSNLAGSTTISFNPSVNSAPAGVANATALNYLTFSPATLTFTAPNQVLTVTATITLPANAAPGAYGYQVYTTGWTNAIDFGASLNSTASIAPVPNPPTTLIATPFDGQVFTVPAANMPTTIPFQFTSVTTPTDPVVVSVDADLSGVPLTLTSVSGLSTASATGSGSMVISAPGTYSLTADGQNSVGTGTDVNQFTVVVTAPPPTVVINTPTPNSTFTYKTGGAPVSVPYTFTATSNYGGIRTLTATLDGAPVTFSATGINALVATGTTSFSFSTAGTHTLSVTTTDDYGTATANSNFTVNVISPTPTIAITAPANAASFNLPTGATTMSIPFSFNTTTTTGWTVDAVSATLDGNAITIAGTTPALGTATATTSTGTMLNVAAGTHVLSATGTSAGIAVSTSVTFTVVAVQALPPPTVVINTPAVGSTYTIASGSTSVSVPLTFTGDSTSTSVAITGLSAKLDGVALTVTPTNLGQKVATGASTMVVTTAGTHTITVTATDVVGTATASRTFTVTVANSTPRSVCGKVFFDFDKDAILDASEFGLSGITVKLTNSANCVVATTTTDCSGNYCFSNISPGTYTVAAVTRAGFLVTTANNVSITISNANVTVPVIGLGLDFNCIKTLTACGNSQGYWKTNIDKALSSGGCSTSSSNGYQESPYNLNCYSRTIGALAGHTFDMISLKSCSSTLGSNSSDSSALLAKQLLASEFNYCKGAYINGDKILTYCFIAWGENILACPTSFTNTDRTFAKNWCEAYNLSHGGLCAGPSQ